VVAFDPSVPEESEGKSPKGGIGDREESSDEDTSSSIITEEASRGIAPFTPDMIFAELVKNYRNAEKLFGKRLIRLVSGYDPGYVRRNIKIAEFRKEIKKRVRQLTLQMKRERLLEGEEYTEKALLIAGLNLLEDELRKLRGMKTGKWQRNRVKGSEFKEYRQFMQGDRFRDVSFKQSIKVMGRRGHKELLIEDVRVVEKEEREQVNIALCIDSSASMKGEKMANAKKAALALSYTALMKGDTIRIVEFNSTGASIPSGRSFRDIVISISSIVARGQTNIAAAIRKGAEVLHGKKGSRQIILVSDALATAGDSPLRDALDAASELREEGLSLSVVGIALDSEGNKFARRLVELGRGRLYSLKSSAQLDMALLEEYSALRG